MRAVVFDQFGEPADVLRVEDRPQPTLEAGEVLVRMLASPVNPSDLMTVRGIYGVRPQLPAVPGYEGVGIVEQAHSGLWGRLLVGKRVAVLKSRTGNWQEYAVASSKSVIPLSASIPLEQAAMFFVNPATAWLMTRRVMAIPAGSWLLQTAATSAVGRMVQRLGHRYRFPVMNVVRRPEQVDELKSAGAAHVVCFDPAHDPPESLREKIRASAGIDDVPFAIDPVGGPTAAAAAHCLGLGGRLLVYGTLSPEPLSLSSRVLMTSASRIEGFWLSRVMEQFGLIQKLRLINDISRHILLGDLAADVETTFPMTDIAGAVRAAEIPGKRGKIILRIAAD